MMERAFKLCDILGGNQVRISSLAGVDVMDLQSNQLSWLGFFIYVHLKKKGFNSFLICRLDLELAAVSLIDNM